MIAFVNFLNVDAALLIPDPHPSWSGIVSRAGYFYLVPNGRLSLPPAEADPLPPEKLPRPAPLLFARLIAATGSAMRRDSDVSKVFAFGFLYFAIAWNKEDDAE